MTDRKDEGSGYGDDQGTRVGRPEHGRSGAPGEYPGVPERGDEREEGETGKGATGGGSSGGRTEGNGSPRNAMGSEAAEGIHGARREGEDADAPSSLSETATGREHAEGATRAGSEPLVERERIAGSSYGGEGGEPRVPPDRPH
jgi:hypothetical protein